MRTFARYVTLIIVTLYSACGNLSASAASSTPVSGMASSSVLQGNPSHCPSLLTAERARTLPASQYSLYATNASYLGRDFLDYVYAIAWIESGFNPKVRSHRSAYGLMQMTEVAMREAAAFCHIPVLKSMDRLLDPATNIKYGTCYLKFLVEQTEEDYVRALIIYNGGYRALQLYEKGSSIPNETAQYVVQVDRVRKLCRLPEKGN